MKGEILRKVCKRLKNWRKHARRLLAGKMPGRDVRNLRLESGRENTGALSL
jgi:hypothetical protein